MNEVVIYTDGACKGNPGPGGWGALLCAPDGTRKELCGGELGTTNNRMEMMAVIQALTALKRPCAVTLHLDSQYVLKGITEWLPGWVLLPVLTEKISVWLLLAITELKSLTSFKLSKAVLTALRANLTAA